VTVQTTTHIIRRQCICIDTMTNTQARSSYLFVY